MDFCLEFCLLWGEMKLGFLRLPDELAFAVNGLGVFQGISSKSLWVVVPLTICLLRVSSSLTLGLVSASVSIERTSLYEGLTIIARPRSFFLTEEFKSSWIQISLTVNLHRVSQFDFQSFCFQAHSFTRASILDTKTFVSSYSHCWYILRASQSN